MCLPRRFSYWQDGPKADPPGCVSDIFSPNIYIISQARQRSNAWERNLNFKCVHTSKRRVNFRMALLVGGDIEIGTRSEQHCIEVPIAALDHADRKPIEHLHAEV